jgi:hypothetical protein
MDDNNPTSYLPLAFAVTPSQQNERRNAVPKAFKPTATAVNALKHPLDDLTAPEVLRAAACCKQHAPEQALRFNSIQLKVRAGAHALLRGTRPGS